MKRCLICHIAIPPPEVVQFWVKKFGTNIKPHYERICKICGKPAGEHYGTDCPGLEHTTKTLRKHNFLP